MKTVVHAIDQLKMGGAQTHLLTILKEMKKQHPEDRHVLIVLFDEAAFTAELEELSLSPVLLHLNPFLEKRDFMGALRKIKKCLQLIQPDVVETHLTWSRLLVNTAAKQLKISKRIGFEQGDIYMNSLKMRLANYISQFFFQHIIVCSDALKDWVIKTHKIKPGKLKVMYNCVSLEKFQPINQKDLASYLALKNPLPTYMFVTVGTMGKGVNKRMDLSIKAIAQLRKQGVDAGLVICGDGKKRNELEALADKYNVKDSILFLGNRSDVARILPHCFAYVHSAPYEPFGIVCIEAMASGLPVVLPNSGGIQYIINNNVEGKIYKSLDVEQLSLKMKELTANPDDYQRIKTAAIKGVQKYGVSAYVKELYHLYE